MTDRSVEDYWEHAPSGHIVAHPDGRIIRVNATLSKWLGYDPNTLCGKPFTDLLTVGGRILYETHFGPLLRMGGDLNGVTVDVVAADQTRMPMFLTANVRTGADQEPELLRISIVDASDRRAYEAELLEARRQAVKEQGRAKAFADTLRRSLLPPVLSPPAGLEAAEYYNAASADDLGGDFYDLFPLSRTTWGFFLGDVSGKGVDAAVVTGLTRYKNLFQPQNKKWCKDSGRNRGVGEGNGGAKMVAEMEVLMKGIEVQRWWLKWSYNFLSSFANWVPEL